jgi:preprotein translocase subunit SecY
MLQAFANIFKIPDLRRRVFFTLGMLAIYRIGFVIPLLGVDQTALRDAAERASEGGASGFGRIMEYASIFSGGSLQQSTIFGLGIMPYITASIIFQLLATVWKPLQDLKKEGQSGQTKINEWTRYATVALCLVQGFMWLAYLNREGLVQANFTDQGGQFIFFTAGVVGLTAGSLFLMWLGEQIDKYGIGNGISLILTAGIVARMPDAVGWVIRNFTPSIQTTEDKLLNPVGLILLAGGFILVVAGAVIITVAQRRIPIQQAKHTRGRRVFGGQRQYLPLRLNHAGVMPIVFASSLMIFPSAIFGWLASRAQMGGSAEWWRTTTTQLEINSRPGEFPYVLLEIILIFFFSYFWTTVQFSPEDMSKQLKQSGAFIPGYRPGPRTAEYLETVMERITYVGGGFLAAIAIIPTVVSFNMGIPPNVSQFLGGTGLLIVVSVGLDLIQRIEANLLMRNYSGFLASGPNDQKAPRVRSRQG